MSTYTEDHLIEQPAIQFMQHELGWDVVTCYDEWSGGVSALGRDGKREGGNIEHQTPNIEHRSVEMRKTLPESEGETEKHFKLAWASPASLALAIHRFPK